MHEYVGTCNACGTTIYCENGFLNGELSENNTLICFSCDERNLKNRVQLSPYQSNWPETFAKEKNAILHNLGDPTIPIEHIGSTSVPNLQAKPIIDILFGVENLDEFTHYIHPLSQAGYAYVPKPELRTRRFFKKDTGTSGTFHLHICEWNSSEWDEKITFRDYLRVNPQSAKAYESLKKQLAEAYREERSVYTKEKGPFIQSILNLAYKKG
ncbi:GrpB family protein [Halobacillus sp. Nhm2S1]|uniref:GrpB family protein n=1 Tax=Halobacillus sp. Nhm2S1 TaxID=2866716 RepID=UPI001C73D640|nr:GrpB family protein [Halobacillus sp. Nhm2S1]MBX0358168.1 GrpB family protein [Halobacillus sp. Nhm2S1]